MNKKLTVLLISSLFYSSSEGSTQHKWNPRDRYNEDVYRKKTYSSYDYDRKRDRSEDRYTDKRYNAPLKSKYGEERRYDRTYSPSENNFDRYERKDVVSKANNRSYISKELNTFIKILERCIDFLSFDENILLFSTIQQQFGDAFTYTVIETLNTGIKDDLMNKVLGNKRFGLTANNALKIDPAVYLSLINALYADAQNQNFVEKVVKIVKEGIPGNIWNRIEPDIIAKASSEKKTSNNSKDDPFADDENDLQKLKDIIKNKQASESRIKAQFVLDSISSYLSQKKQKTDDFAFLKDKKSVAQQERILEIFKRLLKEYEHLLNQNKIKPDFLGRSITHVKKNLLEDHPRAAAYIYGQFLEQIKQDQKLQNQIRNGYRIAVDNAFSAFDEATKDKRKITFNTNLMYLLCIQVLARFEHSISNGDEFTSVEDFRVRIKKLLEDIAGKFNNQGNIDGVVRTIFEAINGRSNQTDLDVLFASTAYKLILSFDFSSKQQNALLEEVKKLFEDNGITLQKVKDYDESKSESIKTNKSLLDYDPQKSLEAFTVSGKKARGNNDEENKDPLKNLEDTAVNTLQDSLSQGIASLFGAR